MMRAMVLSAAGLVIRTRRTPYALMLPAYRDDRMRFATGTDSPVTGAFVYLGLAFDHLAI